MVDAEPLARTGPRLDRDAADERRRTRRWIAIAVLGGVILRLVFALGYWVDRPLTRDEREYLSLARSLAAGHGFVFDPEVREGPAEPFGRAPGYPLFLAAVGGGAAGVPASVPVAVQIAQSVVGGLGILLVAGMAWRLGGPRAARAGAVIGACYPPLAWIPAYAFSEALFWPLGLAIAWSVDRVTGTRSAGAAGALTGAGVLVRPGLLLFLPMVVLWLAARRRHATLAFVLGVVVVLGPWVVRNYAQHGRFVFVATEGGLTFWTGNHPLAIGEGDMAANPTIRRAHQSLRAQHPGLTEDQMEPVYYREAFAWIRQNPADWLVLEVRKVFYLIVPAGPSYTLHSTRYLVASLASYAAILLLAVAGFLRLGERRRRTPGLWLLAASAVGASLLFFPQERFRLSIIDPTLVIAAAAVWSRRSEEPTT